MQWKNSTTRYGTASIILHWLMALLFIAVYACIELREIYPKGSDPREAMKAWHFMLGLSVLLLVVVRLYFKLTSPAPIISPQPKQWQTTLARLGHLALYVLMIGMPLLGWFVLSAAGKPIPFFCVELPPLVDKNKELASSLKALHETIGVLGYYLIGIHAIAALFHHHILKDDTLTRMLPRH